MGSSGFTRTIRRKRYTIMNHRGEKIPVRTIMAICRPKLSQKILMEYFAHYGEITKVSFRTMLRCRKKYARITYKVPEAAAIVLTLKRHRCTYATIDVVPADKYHQPAVKSLPNNDISSSSSDTTNNTLLSLNDDCLLHIFTFLNLAEQVNLSGLCSRLNAIGDIIFRKLKKFSFDDLKNLTILESAKVMQHVGQYIKHFTISANDSYHDYSAKIFTPLCTNLKSVEFVRLRIGDNVYKELWPVLRNLESLTLEFCGLTDNIFVLLKSCKKLQYLDLSNNFNLSGKGLLTLPNTITDLDLSEDSGIEPEHFIKLCKVSNLKKINIDGCDQLFDIAFNLTQIKSLQSIYMSSFNGYTFPDNQFFDELVSKKSDTLLDLSLCGHNLNNYQKNALLNLTNLRHLGIWADDEFLNRLNSDLRSLLIYGGPGISEEGLLNFVEKSQKIQIIFIVDFEPFGSRFVFKLLEKLKILQRPTCLKLVVTKTTDIYSVKREPWYMEFNHLLQIDCS